MHFCRTRASRACRVFLTRCLPLAGLVALGLPGSLAQSAGKSPVSVFVYDRTRTDAWDWFGAPPYQNSYAYVQTLQRLGLKQHLQRWDWELELSQPSVLDAPNDSVSPVTAQGQLGLGGTYYASNGNNSYPAAAFFKQGFARFDGEDKNLRVGRFEFFDGDETKPKDSTLAWLQANRVSSRLISNFGFTNAQRSLDGLDGQLQLGTWNITAMAARSDQGVFNMNGNPELNVDAQYLAFTRRQWKQRLLWRGFAIGYHDGRTGITKTDNRPLSVRQADHANIRIGTYGGDLLTVIPARGGEFDLVGWGALQNGRWGMQQQRAGAAAVEGGYQFLDLASTPWIRGGWFRSSGDDDPADNKHGTFFELLPTPRSYARLPIYNLMNLKDGFVQIVDRPARHWELRSDLHWVQLAAKNDLWYQGGGAFDNKTFGFVGRPSGGAASLASIADISADWRPSPRFDLGVYYSHAWGKTVAANIYPQNRNAQFAFLELAYHWNARLHAHR